MHAEGLDAICRGRGAGTRVRPLKQSSPIDPSLASFLLGMLLPSLRIGYLFSALMPAAVMAAGLLALWNYEAQRTRANENANV